MKKKATILIVEESKVFSSLLSELSENLGIAVTVCSNGAEAIRLAEKNGYDLVCVGYHLFDMTAETFCLHMRRLVTIENNRILLFSSVENPDLLRKIF